VFSLCCCLDSITASLSRYLDVCVSQEAADRGYIPCMIIPKVVPASMVDHELHEICMHAEMLFNSCPGSAMTLHREELVTLTHDVRELCVFS
jgi:hypothetical protein